MMKKAYLPFLVIFILSFQLAGAAAPPLTVSYIDVGQGDSILIQTPNKHTLLIDAGPSDAGLMLSNYLRCERHISRIDVLVGTHPHEDHIGGMAAVVYALSIGQIYLPKVPTKTQIYEETLTSIQDKKMKINTAQAGVAINLDPAVKIEMLAPRSAYYDDLNDYSVVIKMVYGKTSFLFMGDAGRISQKEMLKAKCNLRADVLKVPHSGAVRAMTRRFLEAVAPTDAVISVGAYNRHGFPGESTLERLKKAGSKVYRTDYNGTIQVKSDGARLFFRPERIN